MTKEEIKKRYLDEAEALGNLYHLDYDLKDDEVLVRWKQLLVFHNYISDDGLSYEIEVTETIDATGENYDEYIRDCKNWYKDFDRSEFIDVDNSHVQRYFKTIKSDSFNAVYSDCISDRYHRYLDDTYILPYFKQLRKLYINLTKDDLDNSLNKKVNISTNIPAYRVYVHAHSGGQQIPVTIKLYKDGHLGLVAAGPDTEHLNIAYFPDEENANACADILPKTNKITVSKARQVNADFVDLYVDGIKCMLMKDTFDVYSNKNPNIIKYVI